MIEKLSVFSGDLLKNDKTSGFIIKTIACFFMLLHLGFSFDANGAELMPPVTCNTPANLVPTLVASDTAIFDWDANSPEPSQGYQYFLTQSAVLPTAATVATGNVFVGTTLTLSSLIGSTTYYIYVRTNCGSGDLSDWTGTSFTTNCTAVNVTYVQNFNAVTVPAIPNCNTRENAGAGNDWITEEAASAYPGAGFTTKHLVYEGNSNTADAWYYTQGVRLTAGTSYRISYTFGGDSHDPYLLNKLDVFYGAAPDIAAMAEFDILGNHAAIKSRPIINTTNFIAPRTGVFYFGFHAISAPNSGKLYLDDISVSVSNCLAPTQLLSGQVTATSALINWVGSSVEFDYYYSTAPAAPDATTFVSGSTSEKLQHLVNLVPNNTYYYWIRSKCGNGDYSPWSVGNTFVTLPSTTINYCVPAAASQGGIGISRVVMGSINQPSGYEDGGFGYSNYSNLVATVAAGSIVPVAITYQVPVSYETKIWVDWNNDGDFVDTGELVYTGNSAAANPTILAASFTVPAAATLGIHRVRIGGRNFAASPTALIPCRTNTLQVFEDYSINVVAAVTPLELSASSATVCEGVNSPIITITTGASAYDTFSWYPTAGVTATGGGYRFNTGTSARYTLTAFNKTTLASTTVPFDVIVNRKPTPIVIPIATANVCQAQIAQEIRPQGGIVSGTTILSESFNAGISAGWAQMSGPPDLGRWMLPNDGEIRWGAAFHTNDNSGFAMTDSDLKGNGTNTVSGLRTPDFSLVGYANASMSFWHHLRIGGGGDVGIIEVSTNSGVSYTTIETYTTTQGAPAAFKNTIIDLSAYAGMPTIRVRFRYLATWDYGWAIDNVHISASATSAITWTPATGLFLDSTAMTPYVAGTGAAVVYALPNTATVYTARATTGTSCNVVSNTVSITVTPIYGGNLTSASQQVCNNTTASAITANGVVGALLYWERADDAAFTVNVTPIPGSEGLTTLTPALIGTSEISQFFRTVVSVGGCNNAHSAVHSINVTSSTYNGVSWSNGIPTSATKAIFTGNYTATANLSVCSVEVISGTVRVNPNITLTVANGITVSGGSLVFENNASLIQTTTSKTINTGDILYKRNTSGMVAYDYTFWSSPVMDQKLLDLSPATRLDKFFWWDPVIYDWSQITAPDLTSMDAGKGYIIRAPFGFNSTPASFAGNFTGVPHNGEVLAPVVVSGPANINCYNLIGNPYPSAIDAELLMTQNPGTLNGGTTFYFWTHNHAITNHQYTTTDYASYNLTGGVGTGLDSDGIGTGNNTKPTKWIPAGQGFMAHCHQTGNVVFNNSIRQGGNNANFYKSDEVASDLQKNRLWLELTNSENVYKQLLVGYIENATNGYESGFDGESLDAGNAVNFYSILGDKKLSIQGRALDFDNNEQIPLGLKVTNAGIYTIRLSEKDGFFNMQAAYLEDKITGTIHDLSAGDYIFTSEAGNFETRFVIRYNNTVLNNTDATFKGNDVIAYKKSTSIHVETAGFDMASIRIFDINGRQLYEKKKINSKSVVIHDLIAAQQLLMIQVTAASGTVVYKKIVF